MSTHLGTVLKTQYDQQFSDQVNITISNGTAMAYTIADIYLHAFEPAQGNNRSFVDTA